MDVVLSMIESPTFPPSIVCPCLTITILHTIFAEEKATAVEKVGKIDWVWMVGIIGLCTIDY
jgi:hypothetical protein